MAYVPWVGNLGKTSVGKRSGIHNERQAASERPAIELRNCKGGYAPCQPYTEGSGALNGINCTTSSVSAASIPVLSRRNRHLRYAPVRNLLLICDYFKQNLFFEL